MLSKPQKQTKKMEEEPQQNSNLSKNQVVLYIIVQYNPQRFVSAAIYDDRRRTFQITSFGDNEHYTNLQALLIQTNPHQKQDNFYIHLSIKTQIKSQRQKIQAKIGDLSYNIDQSKFVASVDVNLALSNLLSKDLTMYLKITQDKQAIHALERLLAILKLQQDQTNKKKFELKRFNFDKFMRLDQPAIIALQIFPKDMQKKILASSNTIFEVLNKCKTHIGTRCLKRWMRQPLQNVNEINNRLNKVEYFLKYPGIKNAIQNEIKKLPDLDNLYYTFYKVQAGKKNNVEMHDLIKIYRTITTMQELLKSLPTSDVAQAEIAETIQEIQKNVKIMGTICKMIEDNVVMDGNRQSQFHVRADAQKDLAVIYKEQSKLTKQIAEHIKQVSKDLSTQIQKIQSATYKYVLQADKKKTIDTIKESGNYKYLSTKLNKITFTTENLVSLCKSMMSLEEQYKQKQKQILTKMYKVVAGYFPIMQQLSIILSELDVLTTFASVINSNSGSQNPWCRPVFSSSLQGTKIHNPCVKSCIPNNIDMSVNRTIILTGPNMGGKSTYIRTIGLATYLAHIGCYVPAKQFSTSIIDSIITRVGASDMQMKGISTFMSEMIESVTMLQSSTASSLVLIDELGRGTSTSQGFGIAWAICQELHTKIKPYCLFATHFHEMTQISELLEGVCNMHTSCKIQKDKLQLEYRVLPGKMEKSYGIEVAKMLNFSQHIISDATSYLQFYQQGLKTAFKLSDIQEQQGEPLTQKQIHALNLYKQMNFELKMSKDKEYEKDIKLKYAQKINKVLA